MVSPVGLLNEPIVAACAAGLVAGPWVGLAVSVFVTWLAVAHHCLQSGSIATSLLCSGLIGGLLYRWRPKLAQHPLTGFCLTLAISLLRSGLVLFYAPHARAVLPAFGQIGMAPVLQGLGTPLILAIGEQELDHHEQNQPPTSPRVPAPGHPINPPF